MKKIARSISVLFVLPVTLIIDTVVMLIATVVGGVIFLFSGKVGLATKIVFRNVFVLACWWVLPAAVIWLFSQHIAFGSGALLLGVTLGSTEIWDIFKQLLSAMYLRPLMPYTRQSTSDSRTVGIKVQFVAEKEEYDLLRTATNKAGLWFAHVEWSPMTAKFLYTVVVVQNKKTMTPNE